MLHVWRNIILYVKKINKTGLELAQQNVLVSANTL
jgi:hypothetical protein